MLHNSAKYYELIHLNMFDTSNLSHPDSLNVTCMIEEGINEIYIIKIRL